MGAVYVARHLATENQVALKVLHPHVVGTSGTLDKFMLEARVAARVRSEHIVQVLDAGIDKATNTPFLVMELLDGETLEDHVQHHGPLPPDRVVRYLAQVASALDKAHGYVDDDGHARAIVHRDLKPENLFLSKREDGSETVKILDFGIATLSSATMKVSREIRGTPLFMAPEQIGGRATSPATDIWALGLIAFWLLTGRSYWAAAHREGAGIEALFAEVLTLPMPSAAQRATDLGTSLPSPHAFNTWFSQCVHRDPTERFDRASDATQQLAAALAVDAPAVSVRRGDVADGRDVRPDVAEAHTFAMSDAGLSHTQVPTRSSGSSAKWIAAGALLLVVSGAAIGVTRHLATPAPGASAEPPTSASDAQPAVTALSPTPAASTPVEPSAAPADSAPTAGSATATPTTRTVTSKPAPTSPRTARPKPRPTQPAAPTPTQPKSTLYGER